MIKFFLKGWEKGTFLLLFQFTKKKKKIPDNFFSLKAFTAGNFLGGTWGNVKIKSKVKNMWVLLLEFTLQKTNISIWSHGFPYTGPRMNRGCVAAVPGGWHESRLPFHNGSWGSCVSICSREAPWDCTSQLAGSLALGHTSFYEQLIASASGIAAPVAEW